MMNFHSENEENDEDNQSNAKHSGNNPELQSKTTKTERGGRKLYELSDSDDSLTVESESATSSQELLDFEWVKVGKSTRKRAKATKDPKALTELQRRKQEIALEKQQKKIDREQKKKDALRSKEIRKALSAEQRKLKPDECVKHIIVQIDSGLMHAHDQSGAISSTLTQLGCEYSSITQPIPNTVTWQRKVDTYYMDDAADNLKTTTNINNENFVLLFLTKDELLPLIKNHQLLEHVRNVETAYPGKKLSLGVLKFQSKAAVKVTAEQILFGLTELQLLCNCSYRYLYSSADVASMITQFTKSIAQKPFKLQSQDKETQQNWYIQGANKDCVKVDKQGNGINRLWQQQLAVFPQARLETAESIIEKYPTLNSLMQAYDTCPLEKRELLLADIPVRRNGGPMCASAGRNIGKEFSKKMNIFYNALDGEAILGQPVP